MTFRRRLLWNVLLFLLFLGWFCQKMCEEYSKWLGNVMDKINEVGYNEKESEIMNNR